MKRALVMVLWLLVSHALAVVLYRRGTLPGTRVQLVESEAGLTSQLSAEGWEDMGCSSTHCMSFMFSSLSPLHLRAWMHVSSQGVWNGETQTCDVHSCSLLFLPCIFEHGCTSHHRESWNGETQTCDVHSCSLQERINLRFQSFHEDASSWKVYKFGQKRTNSRFYSFHGAVPMQ